MVTAAFQSPALKKSRFASQSIMVYAQSLSKTPPPAPPHKRSHSDRFISARLTKWLLVLLSIFGVYLILKGLSHFLSDTSHGRAARSGKISDRHRPSLQ